MVVLIEEAPTESGLHAYKDKIITSVDELTECINER